MHTAYIGPYVGGSDLVWLIRSYLYPALAKVGGATRIGTVKGVPVAIARTGTSKYIAFNLKCPHQGITVTRNESGWVCSAHQSEFEPDGDLVLGPATTGLARVPIKVSRGVATLG